MCPSSTFTRQLTASTNAITRYVSFGTCGAATCYCAGKLDNCSSFNTQAAAQACFAYCHAQGPGDIHNLDGDGDGVACEWNP